MRLFQIQKDQIYAIIKACAVHVRQKEVKKLSFRKFWHEKVGSGMVRALSSFLKELGYLYYRYECTYDFEIINT